MAARDDQERIAYLEGKLAEAESFIRNQDLTINSLYTEKSKQQKQYEEVVRQRDKLLEDNRELKEEGFDLEDRVWCNDYSDTCERCEDYQHEIQELEKQLANRRVDDTWLDKLNGMCPPGVSKFSEPKASEAFDFVEGIKKFNESMLKLEQ